MNKRGFTLIEIILYIGIITAMSTVLTTIYIQIIQLRSKSTSIQEVNESVRLAAAKISYEIRQAKSINGVGTSLSLSSIDPSRNPTVFELVNGRIRLTVGTSVAYITSNLVNITNQDFASFNNGVRFTITGNYQNNSASITSSAKIRSQ